MLLLRLGPILIYHYNLTLVVGFVLSLFVVYRLAKREDYNVEKVLDWLLWGILLSVVVVWGGDYIFRFGFRIFEVQLSAISGQWSVTSGQLPVTIYDWGNRFWSVIAAHGFKLELGLLVFIIYTSQLFKRWRWKLFPPLDFAAVGAMFFYLTAAASLSWENYLSKLMVSLYAVPVWLVSFFYYSLGFFLLNLLFKRYYKERRVLALGFVLTLRPILILTGIIWLIMIEWSGLKKAVGHLVSAVLTSVKAVLKSMPKKEKATEEKLEKQEEELEERLEELEEEVDPRSRPERASENAPEDDADEAETGAHFAAVKTIFSRRLNDVRTALRKLKGGSYGVCDRCGKKIDPARLKAKPDAHYCLDCAKELEEAGKA